MLPQPHYQTKLLPKYSLQQDLLHFQTGLLSPQQQSSDYFHTDTVQRMAKGGHNDQLVYPKHLPLDKGGPLTKEENLLAKQTSPSRLEYHA
jgi:hypothetical protein